MLYQPKPALFDLSATAVDRHGEGKMDYTGYSVEQLDAREREIARELDAIWQLGSISRTESFQKALKEQDELLTVEIKLVRKVRSVMMVGVIK